MAGNLEFDAAGSNIDGTTPGSTLSVWSNATYAVTEHSWPAPDQVVQWASSVDTEGSLPASTRHENRKITMTVEVMTAAGLLALQGKVGKIAREGGTLKWTLPNAETVIFDLYSVDSFQPSFDLAYYVNSGAYCTVAMGFTAAPYGRGAEITLSDHVETTLPFLTFTETALKGDWYGIARMVVDNDQAAQAQRFLLWGIRSLRYDSAATAALFYQAESCALASATATTRTGASGSGNTVAGNTTMAASPAWNDLIYLGTSSTAQTHVGTYRVFARVQAPSANVGVTSARMVWKPSIGGSYINGSTVTLSDPASDSWEVIDLGMVTIPKAARGTQGWLGILQANSTVANEDIYVDWIAFIPVGEGSGQATHSSIASGQSVEVAYDGVRASTSGAYWAAVDSYEGDYLRLPPAGAEARTLQVIAKFMREPLGTVVTAGAGGTFGDFIDDMSARITYSPRYLVVPSP